jgi:hypothetical protein
MTSSLQGIFVDLFEQNNFTGRSERVVGDILTSGTGILFRIGNQNLQDLKSVQVTQCDSIVC